MSKRLAFMLAVALGACAGTGSGRVDYAASVTVRSPELVTIEPDVYVLADADEPVFYVDNTYWLYRQNRWYRSHSYDRDWVYVREPALRLRHISQPTAYVRYRARTQEARNRPAPTRQPEPTPFPDTDRWPRTDVQPNIPTPVPQPPSQPPPAYPRPPQGEDPTRPHDRHIDANERAPRDDKRFDPPSPPGKHFDPNESRPDVRPDQVEKPRAPNKPVPPPARVDKEGSKSPPGQVKADQRKNENADKAEREDRKDKSDKQKVEKNEKDKKDRKDKKGDH